MTENEKPSGMKTLPVCWHPDAVKRAIEHVTAIVFNTDLPVADVQMMQGVPVTWQDLVVLRDMAQQFEQRNTAYDRLLTLVPDGWDDEQPTLDQLIDAVTIAVEGGRASADEVERRDRELSAFRKSQRDAHERHRTALIEALGPYATTPSLELISHIVDDVTWLRDDVTRERESRQDWADEAMRLEVELQTALQHRDELQREREFSWDRLRRLTPNTPPFGGDASIWRLFEVVEQARDVLVQVLRQHPLSRDDATNPGVGVLDVAKTAAELITWLVDEAQLNKERHVVWYRANRSQHQDLVHHLRRVTHERDEAKVKLEQAYLVVGEMTLREMGIEPSKCGLCGEPGWRGTDRCNLHAPIKGNVEVRKGGEPNA